MLFDVEPSVAHRLLAPRLVAVVGTRDRSGVSNLAPISNITSVSRVPQVVAVAVYRRWQTYANLADASGFAVSIARHDQLDAIWRLGEKYSGFEVPANQSKLDACGEVVEEYDGWHGPVLAGAIGHFDCVIVNAKQPDASVEFDHGVFFGEITAAKFSSEDLDSDGNYLRNSEPLMQLAGNLFATSSDSWEIDYF